MLIKKSGAKRIEISKNNIIWEYNSTESFSYATALLDWRYPEKKRVVNLDCEELYFVVSGVWIIHSEKGDFEIQKGDTYLFEKREIYWLEWKKLFLVLFNIPKWTIEQHKIVE